MDKDDVKELFRYTHLPDDLAELSKKFYFQAVDLLEWLEKGYIRDCALMKLWEAKNLAVWDYVSQKDRP